MKKIGSLLLILFMVILAAGCSGQVKPQGDANNYAELLFDNILWSLQ